MHLAAQPFCPSQKGEIEIVARSVELKMQFRAERCVAQVVVERPADRFEVEVGIAPLPLR